MKDVVKTNQVEVLRSGRPTIVGDKNKTDDAMVLRTGRSKVISPPNQDDSTSLRSSDKANEKIETEQLEISEVASTISTKREQEFAEEQELAVVAKAEELISSKKYYLPIKQSTANHVVTVLVLVLVCVIVFAIVAAMLLA
jgi:hypothetical protein